MGVKVEQCFRGQNYSLAKCKEEAMPCSLLNVRLSVPIGVVLKMWHIHSLIPRPSLHPHGPTIQFLTACSMQKWKKALYVYYMSGVDVCLGSLMGQPGSIHNTGMRMEGLEAWDHFT